MQSPMGQPQPQGSQQPIMMQPPAVITTKDMSYLKDEMSWLLVASKKCAHFAAECQDPEVKQLIDQIGQMHQRQYNSILSHFQQQNAQPMMQMPQGNQ